MFRPEKPRLVYQAPRRGMTEWSFYPTSIPTSKRAGFMGTAWCHNSAEATVPARIAWPWIWRLEAGDHGKLTEPAAWVRTPRARQILPGVGR